MAKFNAVTVMPVCYTVRHCLARCDVMRDVWLIMRLLQWIVVCSLVAGCSLTVENTSATLAAQNRSIVTEAAQIRETLAADSANVLATSLAAETQVAVQNRANAALLQTVQVGNPPTMQVVAQINRSAADSIDMSMMSDEPGGTVLETYVSSDIRQSDGCGEDRTSVFPVGTQLLYGVQHLQNVPANTLVSSEWYYGGRSVFSDSLVVEAASADLCVWFFLEPYSAGGWAVQFLSNGVPVGERVEFVVEG